MDVTIYIVCATCREALALQWDPVFFAADDPLGGQEKIEGKTAEAALLYGTWPGGNSAPCALAAGAWSALAARSLTFFHRHSRHPGELNVIITRQQPENATLAPEEAFVFPSSSPAVSPPADIRPAWVQNWTLEQRLKMAATFGKKGLWEKVNGPEDNAVDALLLTGWLPPDDQIDKRLLSLVLDDIRGPAAEEALVLRLVLNITDAGLRKKWLLATAVTAYARRVRASTRPRPTPYDNMAPLDLIQAGAVKRLTAAGLIDAACNLAFTCHVPEARMGLLRKTLSDRILDRSLPAEMRLNHTRHARRLFPGLLAELRRERGLAVDPLPSPQVWADLSPPVRSLTALTVVSSGIRAGLISAEVTEVMTTLEVIHTLSFVDPEEAATFAPDVLPLCRDKRIEPPPVTTRLCARARDVHGLLFAVPGTGSWEALVEVIEAMLSVGLGISLSRHFRSLATNSIPVEKVGDLLVGRLADRGRSTSERLQAREALSVLATDAAEEQAVVRRADDLLIAALKDLSETAEFKATIRANLTRWMPERLGELRGSVVERISVPSITDLVPGQSIAGIDQNEVLTLLRNPGTDIGRLLGAIALSESFVRMKPDLAVAFEPLLRARIADVSKFNDRGRVLTVAMQAWFAHHVIWEKLKSSQRPGPPELIASLRRTAEAQELPSWQGEESYAAKLTETINDYAENVDLDVIAAALLPVISDRQSSAWTRLHVYHALRVMRGQGAKSDQALFAALADPGEDPVLRSEAHALLAPRLPQPVYELQVKGMLPRPTIPLVETLFHNLPMFDRDYEGEWLLTPAAWRFAGIVYPDDLVAALGDVAANPSQACAAAALAKLVGQRLPATVGQIANALQGNLESNVTLDSTIEGRQKTFQLADLCADALRGLGFQKTAGGAFSA